MRFHYTLIRRRRDRPGLMLRLREAGPGSPPCAVRGDKWKDPRSSGHERMSGNQVSVDEPCLASLLADLGHDFRRPELLEEALTHQSATDGEGRGKRNLERLEFFGDRVLGLVIAHLLMEEFPEERGRPTGPPPCGAGSCRIADPRRPATGPRRQYRHVPGRAGAGRPRQTPDFGRTAARRLSRRCIWTVGWTPPAR